MYHFWLNCSFAKVWLSNLRLIIRRLLQVFYLYVVTGITTKLRALIGNYEIVLVNKQLHKTHIINNLSRKSYDNEKHSHLSRKWIVVHLILAFAHLFKLLIKNKKGKQLPLYKDNYTCIFVWQQRFALTVTVDS